MLFSPIEQFEIFQLISNVFSITIKFLNLNYEVVFPTFFLPIFFYFIFPSFFKKAIPFNYNFNAVGSFYRNNESLIVIFFVSLECLYFLNYIYVYNEYLSYLSYFLLFTLLKIIIMLTLFLIFYFFSNHFFASRLNIFCRYFLKVYWDFSFFLMFYFVYTAFLLIFYRVFILFTNSYFFLENTFSFITKYQNVLPNFIVNEFFFFKIESFAPQIENYSLYLHYIKCNASDLYVVSTVIDWPFNYETTYSDQILLDIYNLNFTSFNLLTYINYIKFNCILVSYFFLYQVFFICYFFLNVFNNFLQFLLVICSFFWF